MELFFNDSARLRRLNGHGSQIEVVAPVRDRGLQFSEIDAENEATLYGILETILESEAPTLRSTLATT